MTKTKAAPRIVAWPASDNSRKKEIQSLIFAMAMLRKIMVIEKLDFRWLQEFASHDCLDPKEVFDFLWERVDFFKKSQEEDDAEDKERQAKLAKNAARRKELRKYVAELGYPLTPQQSKVMDAAEAYLKNSPSDMMRSFRIEMCQSKTNSFMRLVSRYREFCGSAFCLGLDLAYVLERSEEYFKKHLLPN